MRKKQLAIWAALTFGLAWGLFAIVMPIYNRKKVLDPMGYASVFLVTPFVVQILWFAAVGVYSARRKTREPVVGILLGFGLELLALVILIVISASAHY
ncbi:MAG TPA: hypothetical protein VFO39_18685 [Candidatus Sulfotelmatobacter sp.]|nr:hypothetical protein [Candidatus Sulfotelmatobacter sp.]